MAEVKTYLKNIEVEEGMLPAERLVKYKFDGKEYSGFFFEDDIVDGGLEVEVCISYSSRGWAFVRPVRGSFVEYDKGVQVRYCDLKDYSPVADPII